MGHSAFIGRDYYGMKTASIPGTKDDLLSAGYEASKNFVELAFSHLEEVPESLKDTYEAFFEAENVRSDVENGYALPDSSAISSKTKLDTRSTLSKVEASSSNSESAIRQKIDQISARMLRVEQTLTEKNKVARCPLFMKYPERDTLRDAWRSFQSDDYRNDEQERAVYATVIGEEPMIFVACTGFGKTTIMLFAAFWARRIGKLFVVAVPLLSLRDDILQKCISREIPYSTDLSNPPDSGLLLVTYDALATHIDTMQAYKDKIARICIDEVHTVFLDACYRDRFYLVSKVMSLTRPVTLATATLPTNMEKSLFEEFFPLMRPLTIRTSTDRPNIVHLVEEINSEGDLVSRVKKEYDNLQGDDRMIVFFRTVKECQWLTQILTNIAVSYYSDLDEHERRKVVNDFVSGKKKIVCGTTAFSTGVDHHNVRIVINCGLPYSLESLVQQTGRAGRDNRPSTAITLYRKSSLILNERDRDRMPTQHAIESFLKVIDFCKAKHCLRAILSDYMDGSSVHCSSDDPKCSYCLKSTRPSTARRSSKYDGNIDLHSHKTIDNQSIISTSLHLECDKVSSPSVYGAPLSDPLSVSHVSVNSNFLKQNADLVDSRQLESEVFLRECEAVFLDTDCFCGRCAAHGERKNHSQVNISGVKSCDREIDHPCFNCDGSCHRQNCIFSYLTEKCLSNRLCKQCWWPNEFHQKIGQRYGPECKRFSLRLFFFHHYEKIGIDKSQIKNLFDRVSARLLRLHREFLQWFNEQRQN